MKEYFKDRRGWLAALIFAFTIVFVGLTRLLNKYTNTTIFGMFVVAIIIVFILNSGKPDEDKKQNEEDTQQ